MHMEHILNTLIFYSKYIPTVKLAILSCAEEWPFLNFLIFFSFLFLFWSCFQAWNSDQNTFEPLVNTVIYCFEVLIFITGAAFSVSFHDHSFLHPLHSRDVIFLWFFLLLSKISSDSWCTKQCSFNWVSLFAYNAIQNSGLKFLIYC